MELNLEQILDKGVIISQCCDACPACEFVFSNVETYLKFAEAIGITSDGFTDPCCGSLFTVEETYLKYSEAISSGASVPTDIYTTNLVSGSTCKDDFKVCLEQLKNVLSPSNYDIIKNSGIIIRERLYDQNILCFVLNYIDDLGITDQNEIFNILDNILTKGIVVNCYGDDLLCVASVESFLKLNGAIN